MAEPHRRSPLDSFAATPGPDANVTIAPLPATARFLLRADAELANDLARACGLPQAPKMLRAVQDGEITMARLGPDEYLLTGADRAQLATLRQAAGERFMALTDIGHRMTGVAIEDVAACDLINGACPLDLHPSVSPLGLCTRTIFGKAEIILHRQDTTRFTALTNRSFGEYLWLLLAELAREHH